MSDVIIYLFAKKKKLYRNEWVRKITIEEADFGGSGTYKPGVTLADGYIVCDPEDPRTDECLIISGTVTQKL